MHRPVRPSPRSREQSRHTTTTTTAPTTPSTHPISSPLRCQVFCFVLFWSFHLILQVPKLCLYFFKTFSPLSVVANNFHQSISSQFLFLLSPPFRCGAPTLNTLFLLMKISVIKCILDSSLQLLFLGCYSVSICFKSVRPYFLVHDDNSCSEVLVR